MLNAALLTVGKIGEQFKCPLMDECKRNFEIHT